MRGPPSPIVIGLLPGLLHEHNQPLSLSRKREYLADASGALATRYPEGLASALEKISGHSKIKRQNTSTAHLFFANPLKKANATSLLSTHPPVYERVKRLRKMGTKQ